MSSLKIWGGEPLVGSIAVSGAKNGALPLLFASVVAGGACTFYHVPDIGDTRLAVDLLADMGAEVTRLDRHVLRIDTAHIDPTRVRDTYTERLRASSYLLGACLGRFGACPPLATGGCDFGARPLDCHYALFHALGAVGERELSSPRGLHGAEHTFPRVSVGATVNALLAASRIPDLTVLHGCATEGHIGDLVRFLISIGVEIEGIGTPHLRIRGSRNLRGGSYIVSPDDIEAGTYLFAAAACGGDVTVRDIHPHALEAPICILKKMGCDITCKTTALRLVSKAPLRSVMVETAPAPGFPTDLHPPLAAALLCATDAGCVRECIWAGRFRYIEELARMGAEMRVAGDTVYVMPSTLHPATVTATDLRGGAALVIAALATRGRTTIERWEIPARGYEDMPRKLRALGAVVM